MRGGRCDGVGDTGRLENVHVGIGPRDDPAELFPGDAPSANWRFEVKPTWGTDRSIDFRGPLVAGRRGDRFLYLNWGTVAENGTFKLFRRATIGLSELHPSPVEQALDRQAGLRCTIHLTDAKGNPICARLRPPAIEWRIV